MLTAASLSARRVLGTKATAITISLLHWRMCVRWRRGAQIAAGERSARAARSPFAVQSNDTPSEMERPAYRPTEMCVLETVDRSVFE